MTDLAEIAEALADAVIAALPVWVEACVDRTYRARVGTPSPAVTAAARHAGADAARNVGARVSTLLRRDVAEQRTTPLAVLRAAVSYPTAVLAASGVEIAERDSVEAAMFPEDVYGLTPASFADFGPAVAEAGVAWGAAKAWTLARRRTEGGT